MKVDASPAVAQIQTFREASALAEAASQIYGESIGTAELYDLLSHWGEEGYGLVLDEDSGKENSDHDSRSLDAGAQILFLRPRRDR